MPEYLGFEPAEDDYEAVPADKSKELQEEIDAMLKPLYTKQAVKALEYMRDKIVKRGIVNPNDTQMGVGLRQGRLDMIMELLDSAERINNG